MKPINNNITIEPVVHESFISSQKETYDEIGVVIALPNQISIDGERFFAEDISLKVGDKVYFDSWLAAKYPKNDTEYYWLVKYEDIRAYEESIPKI